MRFTHIDVNFDIRFEGHQNCPKILSMNILRVFSDHHLWRQNWRQYLWTSLCQFNFFVNLLHSLGVSFFDIWHLFDNLTSFWQLDIFLIFWEQIAHGPHTLLPMYPIAYMAHTPCTPYPLCPYCPCAPYPCIPYPQWASLPICPIPPVPHCPCDPLPMWPIPLVPHIPCAPLSMWPIPLVPHTPCAPLLIGPIPLYPISLVPHTPYCPSTPYPLCPHCP